MNKNITHILPTALVDIRDYKGNFKTCHLLIDTASELSYITEGCIKRLGLSRHSSKISLSGISSVKAESTRGHSYLHIRSRNSQHKMEVKAHILGRITSSLPRSNITDYDRRRLDAVRLADPSFHRSNPIDILLGADYVWEVMTLEKLLNDQGNTIAVSTVFGWVVTLVTSSAQQPSAASLLTLIDVDKTMQVFWEVEEVSIPRKLDDEAALVEQQFTETHGRHTDGRYVVEHPFKDTNTTFANAYHGALRRFYSTEHRLAKDPTLRENYIKFMEDYLSLGHMRELSPNEIDVADGRLFYLPHHPIVGKKLRVVFDGSFQDVDNHSLNEKLHTGPSIQRNLFTVCFRFRLHKFVFSADIVKMFSQIMGSKSSSEFLTHFMEKAP